MKLQEYFYPTINWHPYGKEYKDYPTTDYAEIELIPEENDEFLLENLNRYASRMDFDEDELKRLDNPNDDWYEHIIAYVHFKRGTYNLDRIGYCVILYENSDDIELKDKLNEEQKKEIIKMAKESLEKWRKTPNIIDEGDM